MDRFTVFLIDDDVGTLTALSGFLRAAGYAIKTYYSSQAFLSGHDVSIPGCVILDLSLPGLNGLDVQQSLLDQGIERPVIFISGKTAAPEIVRAMRAGAIVNRQPWMFTVVHDQKLLESIPGSPKRILRQAAVVIPISLERNWPTRNSTSSTTRLFSS